MKRLPKTLINEQLDTVSNNSLDYNYAVYTRFIIILFCFDHEVLRPRQHILGHYEDSR